MANTKVTGDVIANGTISTVHIADDAITAAKLDSTATGITFADLAVSGNSTLTGDVTFGGNITIPGGHTIKNDGNNDFEIGSATNEELLLLAGGGMHLRTNGNTERLTILQGGNVGIGNTLPSEKLEITGHLKLTNNGNFIKMVRNSGSAVINVMGFSSGSDTLEIKGGSTGGTAIKFKDTTSDIMVIHNSNVGIGVTSPAEKLHVNSGTGNVPALFESTDNLSLITFKDNNTTTDVGIGADDNDEVFYAGGSERIRIDSSGDLYIGGQTNYGKVTIEQGGNVSGIVLNNTTAHPPRLYLRDAGGAGYSEILANNDLYLNASAVGINKTNLSGNDAKLIIDSGDGKHPAIKVNDGGANGFTMLADNYTATESQFNIGVGYSGGQGVISHNCKVSDTANNVFLSSNAQGATKPMALSFDAGDFVFRNTNTSATTAVDSAVTLTERMRIDSSGNVGIGTTTFASTSNLQLKLGNMGSGIVGEIFDAVDNADNSRIIICGGGTGTPQFSMRHYSAAYGIDMWLNTSNPWDTYIDNRNGASGFIFRNNCNNDGSEDELMRIDGSGRILAGTQTRTGNYDSNYFVRQADGSYVMIISNTQDDIDGQSALQLNLVNTSATTSSYFLICRQGGIDTGTNRMIVFANGNIQNSNNSYGSLSDERKKENIVDATPKLDELMKVKVRNFNLIGEETKQIGVVAQELEQVFPGMISESKDPDSDDETLYKSVKYSVFVPIMIKAMQEQQEIINDLKNRIQTLENN